MYKLEKIYPTGGSANSRCRCAGRAVCGVRLEVRRSGHNAYRHIRTRLDVGSDRDVQLPERIPVLEGSRRTGWTCGGGCASRIWRWRPLGDSLYPDAELAKRICQSGNGFYLLVLDVFSVAGYAVARLYTAERLILIALMVIPMLAGLGLGALILKLMSERVFRYAVMTIINSSSIFVLIRAVASI